MQQNREGLTFEEWVCAAGVAKFKGEEVLPYTTSERTTREIPPERRRWYWAPHHREIVRHSTRHYKLSVRKGWLAGEDPTDWRAALSAKKESAS